MPKTDLKDVGTRVFAIRNADDTTIYLYGCGTYVGDKPLPGSESPSQADIDRAIDAINLADAHPVDVRPFYQQQVMEGKLSRERVEEIYHDGLAKEVERMKTPIAERALQLHRDVSMNPCIHLDSGDVVWGYQSSWAAEEMLPNDRKIVTVPVPEENERWR